MRYGTGLWGNVRLRNGREVELRENAGWIEWRYVGASTWTQLYQIPQYSFTSSYIIFEKELADGENNINIGTTLQNGFTVYLNGTPLNSSQWSGIGTSNLELSVDGMQYDKLIVVGTFTGIFEKELADGETNIIVGFTINSNSQVFFNGNLLMTSRWSGVGTNTLTLLLPVARYDTIKLINRLNF